MDGQETDVDCGGWECDACAGGAACTWSDDCASGVCDGGVCDCVCGEPGCDSGCADGAACTADDDCASGQCFVPVNATEGTCADCGNGVKDGEETDVDCGGDVCRAESVCGEEGGCEVDEDCFSGACTPWSGVCGTCTDLEQNGRETDIDCGGSDYWAHAEDDALDGDCPPCPNSWYCVEDDDCWSQSCVWGECQACDDGERQGDETDVDCGGDTCDQRCATGDGCRFASDCEDEDEGALCLARRTFPGYTTPDARVFGICSLCTNGEQDGDETDVDCGGSCGLLCPLDAGCLVSPDCESGYCQNHHICAEPPTPEIALSRLSSLGDVEYAAPSLGDLDGDGVLDLALGTADDGILLLRGSSSGSGGFQVEPHWAYDVLVGDAEARFFRPSLGDVDDDGDLDIVAGSADGDLTFFVNYGNATWPEYAAAPSWTTDYWVTRETTDDGLQSFAAPVFADLDNDGDMDMVIGSHSGRLDYLVNDGWTSSVPDFVQLLDEDSPFDGLDFGSSSMPAFCDVDGDGDLDLNIGLADGTVAFVENAGTAARALFLDEASFDPWTGVDVGESAAPACVGSALVLGALDAVYRAELSDCTNGEVDGHETDVDCGGDSCGKCDSGQACDAADDCSSGLCVDGTCSASPVAVVVAVPVCAALAAIVWLFAADAAHSDYVRYHCGQPTHVVQVMPGELVVLAGVLSTAAFAVFVGVTHSLLGLAVLGGALLAMALARRLAQRRQACAAARGFTDAGLAVATMLDADTLRLWHWKYVNDCPFARATQGFPRPVVLRASLTALAKEAAFIAALVVYGSVDVLAVDVALGFACASLALKAYDKYTARRELAAPAWAAAAKPVSVVPSPAPVPMTKEESLKLQDLSVGSPRMQQPESESFPLPAPVTRKTSVSGKGRTRRSQSVSSAMRPTKASASAAAATAARKASLASDEKPQWKIVGPAKLLPGESRRSSLPGLL